MDKRETKTCSVCEVEKSLSDYYRKNHSQCKKCHYKDTDLRRKKVNAERKDYFLKLLGGKCNHCGGIFPKECYDFHHVDPSKKDFHFNSMNNHSMERLQEEINKCILLCSNCHRIEHANLRRKRVRDGSKIDS